MSVGERIRALRRGRGQTLVQLAAATGMSQPFLSLVERGHARLSLASMGRIAAEFGVQSGDLLAHQPADRTTTETTDVVPSAYRGDPTSASRSVWQLAELPGRVGGVEMFSAETTFTDFGVHDHDEFVYVLAGTLEVGLRTIPATTVGEARVLALSAGGSMTFASGTDHAWRAAGPEGYRVLVVTTGG